MTGSEEFCAKISGVHVELFGGLVVGSSGAGGCKIVDGIGGKFCGGSFGGFGHADGLLKEVDGFGVSSLMKPNESEASEAVHGGGVFGAAAIAGFDGGEEECFGGFVATGFDGPEASVASGFSEGILACERSSWQD